jgi:hypothetical protein
VQKHFSYEMSNKIPETLSYSSCKLFRSLGGDSGAAKEQTKTDFMLWIL